MQHRVFLLAASFAAAVLPSPALAHLGHVADLAGHSHWFGLAGLGLAAGILALLPEGRKKQIEESEQAEEPGEAENNEQAGTGA